MKLTYKESRLYLENDNGNRLEFTETLIGISWEYTQKECDAFLGNLTSFENALIYRNNIAHFNDKLTRAVDLILNLMYPRPPVKKIVYDHDDDGDYYGDENLDTFKTFD